MSLQEFKQAHILHLNLEYLKTWPLQGKVHKLILNKSKIIWFVQNVYKHFQFLTLQYHVQDIYMTMAHW